MSFKIRKVKWSIESVSILGNINSYKLKESVSILINVKILSTKEFVNILINVENFSSRKLDHV